MAVTMAMAVRVPVTGAAALTAVFTVAIACGATMAVTMAIVRNTMLFMRMRAPNNDGCAGGARGTRRKHSRRHGLSFYLHGQLRHAHRTQNAARSAQYRLLICGLRATIQVHVHRADDRAPCVLPKVRLRDGGHARQARDLV